MSPEEINPETGQADIGADRSIQEMLTRAHGILMIIAWPVLAVMGIFFAAWMRPALPNGEWFQVHRAFMLASLLFGIVGFILIFAAQYNRPSNPGLINLGDGFVSIPVSLYLPSSSSFGFPSLPCYSSHPVDHSNHGKYIFLGCEKSAMHEIPMKHP